MGPGEAQPYGLSCWAQNSKHGRFGAPLRSACWVGGCKCQSSYPASLLLPELRDRSSERGWALPKEGAM